MPNLFRKPWVCKAQEAHLTGKLRYDSDLQALLSLDGNQNEEIVIPQQKQFDLTQATFFGLNERLTSGANSPMRMIDGHKESLRDLFNMEWENYESALMRSNGPAFDYGYYAYYYDRGELVRYCDPIWHRVVSVATSSKLYTDPDDKLSWDEVQNLFANTVIGVAGCSVGSRVADAIMMDIRPSNIKIADKSTYKMENINRVRASYWDIVKPNSEKMNPLDTALQNKAVTVARQISSIDPFVSIHLYEEGLDEKVIDQFFVGERNEPALNYIFDEVDDPRVKLLIRQKARQYGVPVIMVTDIGSCVQVDIQRYDLDQKLPLALGATDATILKTVDELENKAGDRSAFFDFVDQLIGTSYRSGQMQKIINLETEIPTATMIPQLGSTAMVAGGVAAEVVARLILGYTFPSQMVFNKETFETSKVN